jgi:ABC-type branched-subunit amino acid transport system substrate-binding protein
VANDSLQGPNIAKFVAGKLRARQVLIVGDPEAYSTELSASMASTLRSEGVTVRTATIPLDGADPAAAVKAMTASTDVVILALLQPTDATDVADAITKAGFRPRIVASDAMFDLNTFRVPGAYVSTFSPDLGSVPGGAKLVALYKSIFGDLAPFGGPSYVAMEAMLTAALSSCRDGQASRAGTSSAIGRVKLDHTILGRPVAFTRTGDLKDGSFSIYRIEGDGYVQVR